MLALNFLVQSYKKNRGISTVVVNSRHGGCPLCAPYIGKVFIDDVYSGGTKADGNYPLLSDAIQNGLFHPNCKDSTSTYYEGITTLQPVTEEEQAEMERREKLEAQEKYYENQAKKNHRIADHSLDKDNKKIYSHRAKQSEKKAAQAAKKLEKTVENSGESGIITLNRKINRKNTNIGAFSNLKMPLQKKTVLATCKKYGIDTKGITFKIQRSEKMLGTDFYGSTDYNSIGRIDLFPNAFIDEEQLVRTILHEKCHYKQLIKYGKKFTQENLAGMERRAYRFEKLYYYLLKKRVKA